jgi:predicted nucleic-acid-binding Zn-ribbon protein
LNIKPVSPMKTCPKCNSSMEKGYRLDFIENTQVFMERWISEEQAGSAAIKEGKLTNLGPISSYSDALLFVTTYRCSGCGYLESYAK